MRFLAPALAALLAACPGASRAASGSSVWDHNGSLVKLQAEGNLRVITYVKPRPAILRAGVRPGTVLFRGRREGDTLRGTAYTFREGCPPAPYPVRGPADEPGRLELNGAAPVWAGRSCDLVGATPDSPHGNLVFRYLHRVGAPEAGEPEPAPTRTRRAAPAPEPAPAPGQTRRVAPDPAPPPVPVSTPAPPSGGEKSIPGGS